ncbi:monocarboxylate transporter 9 [Procambarus clarkii]|uniref:monocarboxylate transporter 9 n=1 Tax=Procambarus clarkii TaxID=6728 RepID=UPI003743C3B2
MCNRCCGRCCGSLLREVNRGDRTRGSNMEPHAAADELGTHQENQDIGCAQGVDASGSVRPSRVQPEPDVQRPRDLEPDTTVVPQQDRFEAPDGGWGWVVAAGVFLIALVVPMLSPSFGILFSRQLLEWRASTTTVAIIYSAFMLVWKLSSVIVASLVREFGFRRVAMTGTLLTSSCLTISAFATSPQLLFLFFSLGCGLGCGLSCVGYLILAQYFEAHRGLANACLMAGAGLGHFISPLLIRFLQEEYGFKGATVILGAVILHGFVGATLLHPVEWHRKSSKVKKSSCKTEVVYVLIPETENQEGKSVKVNGSNSFNTQLRNSKCTKADTSTYLHNVSGGQNGVQTSFMSTDLNGQSSADTSDANITNQDDREVSVNTQDDREVAVNTQDDCEKMVTTQDDCEKTVNTQDDCEKTVNTQDDCEKMVTTQEDRQATPGSVCGCGCVLCCALIHVFRSIIEDIRILRQPSCLIIAMSSTLTVNGEANFTVLVPFAIQASGHSLQAAAWCVSLAGITSFLARMCVSTLSDFPWFNMRLCYMAGVATMGLSIIVFTLQSEAVWQAAAMGVFGCASGGFYGLNNLLMTQVVGLGNLTAIYGAKNFLVALGFFTVGPVIGVVRDATGSYALSMWVLAALTLASSLAWFFMPSALAYDLRRAQTTLRRSQTTCAPPRRPAHLPDDLRSSQATCRQQSLQKS